jgi:hypothetical protein
VADNLNADFKGVPASNGTYYGRLPFKENLSVADHPNTHFNVAQHSNAPFNGGPPLKRAS